jgi:hypothetical protein
MESDNEDILTKVIGMDIEDAKHIVKEVGFTTRIEKLHDEEFAGNFDLQLNRVNLTVVNGKVTEADIG